MVTKLNKSTRIALVIVALAIVGFVAVYFYAGYQAKKRLQETWDTEVAYYVELAKSEDWLYINYEVEYTATDSDGRIRTESTKHMVEWYRDNWWFITETRNVTRQEMWDEMQDFLEWQEENDMYIVQVGLHIDETVRVIFFLRAIPGTESTRFVGWVSARARVRIVKNIDKRMQFSNGLARAVIGF